MSGSSSQFRYRPGGLGKLALQQASHATGPGNSQQLVQAAERGDLKATEILDFVQQRLGTVEQVQAREVEASFQGEQREWIHEVMDHSVRDVPNAPRWRLVSDAYLRAAEAAASGDLRRAASLLRQAVEQERLALEATSRLVNLRELDANPEDPPSKVPNAPAQRRVVPRSIRETAARISMISEQPHRLWEDDPPPERRLKVKEEEEEDDADGA